MANISVINFFRKTKVYKERREVEDEGDYRKLFRFDQKNVEWLANYFLGDSHERRGGALSSYEKMKTFLRYVADPGFQTGVGEDIGCDQTTVCKIVNEVNTTKL